MEPCGISVTSPDKLSEGAGALPTLWSPSSCSTGEFILLLCNKLICQAKRITKSDSRSKQGKKINRVELPRTFPVYSCVLERSSSFFLILGHNMEVLLLLLTSRIQQIKPALITPHEKGVIGAVPSTEPGLTIHLESLGPLLWWACRKQAPAPNYLGCSL